MVFEIGTAKVDITPNYNSPTRRWNLLGEGARLKETAHPLYARTIAFSDGEKTTTVTSLEVACLYRCHYEIIRALVRQMAPCPVDNIILHNTHQHSDSFIEYEPAYDIFGLNEDAFDMAYIQSLWPRIASSICLALGRMQPAIMANGAGAVEEGIASCRRFLADDGKLSWRGSRPSPEARELPRGHIDPEVGVIAFYDMENNPMAVLYNYACHPSAAGGDSPAICSADYPGFASELIETNTGAIAIFLHGSSGDINPARYVRGSSTDFCDRIADARRMGRIMANEVMKTLGLMEAEEVRGFSSLHKEVLLPVNPEAGNTEAALANAHAALEKWRQDGADPRTALRKYVMSYKLKNGKCATDFFALRLNGTAISFIPGEPFTELGEKIKSGGPADRTLVAATCGEDPFYMPTRAAFADGGYETSYIALPETGESLVDGALNLLHKADW